MAGAAAVDAFATSQGSAAHGIGGLPTSGGSGLTAFLESITAGATKAVCNGVLTCSITMTTVAYSEVLVIVGAYTAVAPSAVATNKLADSPILIASSGTTAPEETVYGYFTGTSAVSTINYVNMSSSTYYDLEVVGIANTVNVAPVVSGSGTGGAPTGTSTTCSGLSANVPQEEVINVVSALASEGTVTPVAGATLLDKEITSTNFVTTEDDYILDTGTGSYTPGDTLSTSAAWQEVCIGLLPATVPPAPTGLTTGAMTSTTIALTWTNPAGPITAAEVYTAPYVSGSCGGYSANVAATTPFTGATATGLTAGTAYCLEVTVSNSTGASGFSIALTDVVTPHAPAAPNTLSATAQDSSTTVIVLAWVNPFGTILNYTLLRATGSTCTGTGTHTAISTAPTTKYLVTGLAAGTTYSFNLAAYNSTGIGAWSACVSGTTNALPAAPTGLGATSETTTMVSLAWTQPSGPVINDTVVVGKVCGSWTTYYSVGVSATFTVSSLNPGVGYCFAVVAWSSGGMGSFSSTLSVTTLSTNPSVPTVLHWNSIAGTSVALGWTNPSLADGVLINTTVYFGATCGYVAGNGPGTWVSSQSTGGAFQTANVGGLSPNTAYCFSVTAWTTAGQGGQSNNVTLTTYGMPPGAPTALTFVSSSHDSVSVNWTNPVGAVVNDTLGYGTTAGCVAETLVSTGGAALSWTQGGLTSATTYYWEVSAWTNGGESAFSACITGATQGATPPAPYDLAALYVGLTFAYIAWTNPSGYTLTDNQVFVSFANGTCGTWAPGYGPVDLGGVVNSYNITGLSPDSNYCIQVNAIDAASPLSAPLYVSTTLSGPAPATVDAIVTVLVVFVALGAFFGLLFVLRGRKRVSPEESSPPSELQGALDELLVALGDHRGAHERSADSD
ncbi:MAG: fibronectin type III domain-containing protein [Thermoplasmata archaeon]